MMGFYYWRIDRGTRQRGAVLFVALIFLLLLTMLGVSSMQTTVLEEKMASNTRERAIAFQAAESALRDAESYIEHVTSVANFNGSDGLYGSDNPEPSPADSSTWLENSSATREGTGLAKSGAPPRYMIKRAGIYREDPSLNQDKPRPPREFWFFRNTARGVGGTEEGGAEVMLRSYYGREF